MVVAVMCVIAVIWLIPSSAWSAFWPSAREAAPTTPALRAVEVRFTALAAAGAHTPTPTADPRAAALPTATPQPEPPTSTLAAPPTETLLSTETPVPTETPQELPTETPTATATATTAPVQVQSRAFYVCGYERCLDSREYGQLILESAIEVWASTDPSDEQILYTVSHHDEVLVVAEQRLWNGPGGLWLELGSGGWVSEFWITEERCTPDNLEQYSYTNCTLGEY